MLRRFVNNMKIFAENRSLFRRTWRRPRIFNFFKKLALNFILLFLAFFYIFLLRGTALSSSLISYEG